MSELRMKSKLLGRIVDIEILPSFVFVEGVRYSWEDMTLLQRMEPQDVVAYHAKKLCALNGFVEVTSPGVGIVQEFAASPL